VCGCGFRFRFLAEFIEASVFEYFRYSNYNVTK
jgi:hypothetical protein